MIKKIRLVIQTFRKTNYQDFIITLSVTITQNLHSNYLTAFINLNINRMCGQG